MSEMKDVFISYRRDGGATVARMLAELLKARNVSVFFDAETLKSGDFGQQITNHLNNSANVILVVTPNLFDRCANENDWVRKELERALEMRPNNIIPVFVNGVGSMPDDLPESIATISKLNGIAFEHDNFDEAFEKLLSQIKRPLDTLIDTWLSFPTDERYNLDTLKMHIEHFFEMEFVTDQECNQLVRLVFEHYRSVVKRHDYERLENFEPLFAGYRIEAIKELCEDLKIDKTGSETDVIESLYSFSTGKSENVEPRAEEDRAERFREALYKHCEDDIPLKNRIKEVFGIKGRNKKDIFDEAFYCVSHEEFLEKIKLTKKEANDIARELFGDQNSSRHVQINEILKYLNYEFYLAGEDDE